MNNYSYFLFGLIKFMKSRVDTQEAFALAKGKLRGRIAHREENFFSIVEKGIYGYSKSPYMKILSPKQIKFSDIKNWVENKNHLTS